MDNATLRKVLPAYTLYKKGKIGKRRHLVWQMDSGRLFIRRECCGKITNVTSYDICHAEVAGEIIGYSMNCLHCNACESATHFVLDRWKPPNTRVGNAFRYARKVMGNELRFALGGTRLNHEWVYLYTKDTNAISVQWKDGGFFPSYGRSGISYETLAEALKAGVESFHSHILLGGRQ